MGTIKKYAAKRSYRHSVARANSARALHHDSDFTSHAVPDSSTKPALLSRPSTLTR